MEVHPHSKDIHPPAHNNKIFTSFDDDDDDDDNNIKNIYIDLIYGIYLVWLKICSFIFKSGVIVCGAHINKWNSNKMYLRRKIKKKL